MDLINLLYAISAQYDYVPSELTQIIGLMRIISNELHSLDTLLQSQEDSNSLEELQEGYGLANMDLSPYVEKILSACALTLISSADSYHLNLRAKIMELHREEFVHWVLPTDESTIEQLAAIALRVSSAYDAPYVRVEKLELFMATQRQLIVDKLPSPTDDDGLGDLEDHPF